MGNKTHTQSADRDSGVSQGGWVFGPGLPAQSLFFTDTDGRHVMSELIRLILILLGIVTFIFGLVGHGVDSYLACSCGAALAAYIVTDPLSPWN